MEIDLDISNWILEYLLSQPLEDRTLDSLLAAFPLNGDDLKLQRLLLLRKLELEASRRNSSSETTLPLLERLEEVAFRAGEDVLDSMKRAYCAVAVKCTVKHLLSGNEDESVRKFEFFEAVKRIWRHRIGRMEKEVAETGGLLSEELLCWKDDVEAAVWEDSVCERVMEKSREIDADGAVDVYVKEERARMGPSFLEMVAERATNDGVLQEILGMSNDERLEENEGTEDVFGVRDPDNGNHGKDVEKEQNSKRESTCFKRQRGLRISENDDEVPGEPSKVHYNLPGREEVDKVMEALVSSSLELRAVVKDPLPSALRVAEAISEMTRQDKDNEPVREAHVEADTFTVNNGGVDRASRSMQSLMERNGSARTYEWDDSIDEEEDGQRLHLPSPRRSRVSPLKKYEAKDFHRRRKRKAWSTLEEDALRAGVQKHGLGCWKLILTNNEDIFVDRTDVDLKDKWRNLNRY